MVVSVNNSYVLGLFGSSSAGSSSAPDLTTLAVVASMAPSASALSAPAAPKAPTTPWANQETSKQASANVQNALAGHNIIGSTATPLTFAGGATTSLDPKIQAFNQDFQKLFSLYQGLSTLSDVATQAQTKNISATDLSQLGRAFSSGLTQVSGFIDSTRFTNLRLALGTDGGSTNTSLKAPMENDTYTTPPLTNSMSTDIASLDGAAQFSISVKTPSRTVNVPIDLSALGSQPRSLTNIILYANSQLAAAGVATRLGSNRFVGQPTTIKVGSQQVTVSQGVDQFGMKVNVSSGETVTFSAPQTAGALYIAQTVGNPDPDHDPTTNDGKTNFQLAKFQTDTTNVATPPQIAGQGNFVDGRTFAQNLDPDIKAVRSTQVGADGSVYMLADVTGNVNGQSISGTQDVALLKYDSAGHLIYTRTLGDSGSASGLSLAVSADGKVAVAGSITGALTGATEGAINSDTNASFADNTDSFVTLYDANGDETWTERRGARLNDEADQVAFGANDAVYVAGRAQGQMPGSVTPIGGYDGYLESFSTSTTGTPSVGFTDTFGTTGADKPQGMVVNGSSVITASVENGHAVLRSFDATTGAQTATRDLGDLGGGSIAGLAMNNGQLVVAGTAGSGAALSAGSVTSAASGGSDAFAAQISADLTNQPSDSIAYYGGSGDDLATGVAVSGGDVYLTGQAGTDLPNQPQVGTKDGFIAGINVAAGTVDWSRRFTGADQYATPTAIAASPGGASILDRLGLPQQAITVQDSQQLASQSALRPGDQFTVSVGNGGLSKTVTIDPGETYDTLVQKVNRASGFEATASVVHNLDGTETMKIVPTYAGVLVKLGPGPDGQNALPMLGLAEGELNLTTSNNGKTVPADGGAKIYGLGLSSNLNLSNASQIAHALASVSQAMGVVRTAYQDLVKAEQPPSAQNQGKTGGTVPTYLTNQIADMQAALARLTGGASSSTSSLLA